jgi:hypothetical protein
MVEKKKIIINIVPDQKYFCPIFNKTIAEGLCWKICFAGSLIKKEAIPELMAYLGEKKLSLQDVHDIFCDQCKFCMWERTKS